MRPAGALAVVALLGVLAAFAFPHAGSAANPQLTATVSDNYTISLTDAGGNPVTSLAPGRYDIDVHDNTALHNFHLTGPGVDKSTPVPTTATTTWTVTFLAGESYHFQCDAHPTLMYGDFTITGGTTSSSTTATTTTTTTATATATTTTTTTPSTTYTAPTTTMSTTTTTTSSSTTTATTTSATPTPHPRKPPPPKVTICHRGRTVKILKSQLRRHLKHGDKRGACRKKRS